MIYSMEESLNSLTERLLEAKAITLADYEVYRWLKKIYGSEMTAIMGLMINIALQKGDTYIQLKEIAGRNITEFIAERGFAGDFSSFIMPDEKSLANEINRCIKQIPGIFWLDDKGRMFFNKIFGYEKTAAEILIKIIRSRKHENFNPAPGHERINLTDEQKKAVEMAGLNSITVISGGPGTGKTTVVKSIIEKMAYIGKGKIRIAVAAPTGKAVSRLASSLEDSSIRLTEKPMTIHRLLGVNPYGTSVRYSEKNRLPFDMVIIDEFSMVSLEMAYRVLRAIPEGTGLVLIGDKNQLASVEMGAVMREICSAGPDNPLNSRIVGLDKNFRFGEDSGIGKLSAAIKAYAANRHPAAGHLNVSDILNAGFKDLRVINTEDTENILDEIAGHYFENEIFFEGNKPGNPESAISYVKVITPFNEGPYGAESLNYRIDQRLRRMFQYKTGNKKYHEWYPGRQVIIGTNDYQEDLYNGDIGICANVEGENRIVFPAMLSAAPELDIARSFEPSLLPIHNLAFAITVHKSQGSEFDNVYFFISNKESDMLNRELIYTAITRAKKKLTVIGNIELFIQSLGKNSSRKSIIAEFLSNRI